MEGLRAIVAMNSSTGSRMVLVCQQRACRKQGAVAVLAALQRYGLPDVQIRASACLGQCGNGPMVRVLPEEVWYWRVQVAEVPRMVEQHLRGGQPVEAMVYPQYPEPN